jgi:hypothetical protein
MARQSTAKKLANLVRTERSVRELDRSSFSNPKALAFYDSQLAKLNSDIDELVEDILTDKTGSPNNG